MARYAMIPIATVVEHVAFELGHPAERLLDRTKRKLPARARAAIAWLAIEVGHRPLVAVAAALGRDKGTIHAAKRRAEMLRLIDADFRALTETLAAVLRNSALAGDL